MSDSLLDRPADRRTRLAERLAVQFDADAADDLGCFGWLRGVRERALFLELRKKTGNICAVPYALLESLEFDPSEGVTLIIAGRAIPIRGRHLNTEVRPLVRLFEGLTRHRVPWIREATEPELMASDGTTTLIERIEW